MANVINTISGSIPSTGFSNMLNMKASTDMIDCNATSIMTSDFNSIINNSCINLHKLNGIQRQRQLEITSLSVTPLPSPSPSPTPSSSSLPLSSPLQYQNTKRWHQHHHHQQQQQQQQQQQHQQQLESLHESYVPYHNNHNHHHHHDHHHDHHRSSTYTCTIPERNANTYLWIVTPVAASISVAIVIAALAGPQWLFTEEKLPHVNYNGSTVNINTLDNSGGTSVILAGGGAGTFITKYTKSSLWILCSTVQGMDKFHCIKIDYFSKEPYQPDPNDTTAAITYTVTKSCPLFLISGLFLLCSFIVFLIPTCSQQNSLYYFTAGIMFIVSGLLMLIGLIAYISILKAEIGSKLRPRFILQPPLFKVTYGQSFFLYVFGFIATEFVGLLNIFLYTSLQEISYYSHLPCFTLTSLKQKIKEGQNQYSHTYKVYKKHEKEECQSKATTKTTTTTTTITTSTSSPMLTAVTLATAAITATINAQTINVASIADNRHKNQYNRKHQVHMTTQVSKDIEDDKKMMMTTMMRNSMMRMNGEIYVCRKYPNGMASSMFLHDLDRRYYLEQSDSSYNNLHLKTKSMSELYRKAPSTAVNFSRQQLKPSSALPPPTTLHTRGKTQLPQPPQQFSDLPQEFPLTRSISTATNINMDNYNHNGIIMVDGEHCDTIATTTINTTISRISCNDNNLHKQNKQQNHNRNSYSNRGINATCNVKHESKREVTNNNVHLDKVETIHRQQKQLKQQKFQEIQKVEQSTKATRTTAEAVSTAAANKYHKRHKNLKSNIRDIKILGAKNKHHYNDHDTDEHDTDDIDLEEPISLCGLRRGLRRTKDELFDEFCKKAGVRPKSKNIYYIRNEHENELQHADTIQNVNSKSSQRHLKHIPFHTILLHRPNKYSNTIQQQNSFKNQENLIKSTYKYPNKINDSRITSNTKSHYNNGELNSFPLVSLVNGTAIDNADTNKNDDDDDDDDDDDNADNNNEDNGDADVDLDINKMIDIDEKAGDIDENDNDKINTNYQFQDDNNERNNSEYHQEQLHRQQSYINGNNNYNHPEYMESNHHLKRPNSNQSLQTLYASTTATTTTITTTSTATSAVIPTLVESIPKHLYDINGVRIPIQASNKPLYYAHNIAYGGSQNHLHSIYNTKSMHMYEAGTIPRTILKRTPEKVFYNKAQLQQQQNQQQLQQQLPQQLNHMNNTYKSNEDLCTYYARQQLKQLKQQQFQPLYLPQQQQQHHLLQHPIYVKSQYGTNQMLGIPISLTYNNPSLQQQPIIKWPATIPSTPSNFLNNYYLHEVATSLQSPDINMESSHSIFNNPLRPSNSYVYDNEEQAQIEVADNDYADDHVNVNHNNINNNNNNNNNNDNNKNENDLMADAFDLDEIERERRRSHVNFFNLNTNNNINLISQEIEKFNQTLHHPKLYDNINGTAV